MGSECERYLLGTEKEEVGDMIPDNMDTPWFFNLSDRPLTGYPSRAITAALFPHHP